jgi:hypothetical protein
MECEKVNVKKNNWYSIKGSSNSEEDKPNSKRITNNYLIIHTFFFVFKQFKLSNRMRTEYTKVDRWYWQLPNSVLKKCCSSTENQVGSYWLKPNKMATAPLQ